MDQIKVSLETLAASVNARMTAFEQELQKEPATKVDSIKSLSADFQCFREIVVASLGALQRQVEMLSAELDSMEMRSRRKMLLFHGVAEEKSENTVAAVVAVAQKYLSLPELRPEDIRRAHRMGRLSTTSDKPRPVLVKFVCSKTRDDAWGSKVGLKGTGITVSEFLTQRRHKLFKAARLKLGVTRCWTREGRIIYLAPDGKRHTIASQTDLEKLVGDPQSPRSKRGTGALDNAAHASGMVPPVLPPTPTDTATSTNKAPSANKDPPKRTRTAAPAKK